MGGGIFYIVIAKHPQCYGAVFQAARDVDAHLREDGGDPVKYTYLFLSVAFNVGSYLLYKSLAGRPGGLLWAGLFACGLALGGINVLFFTKALKEIQLSIAYPVFSGACIFLMALFSHALFGERLSSVHVMGAVVIVAGIAMMSA